MAAAIANWDGVHRQVRPVLVHGLWYDVCMARQTTTAPKPDDPAQYRRFRDLAAELGTEDDEKAVDRAIKTLGKASRPPKPAKKTKR